MHLRGNETIQHIYRRHYFPFILTVLKVVLASFPFYFLLYLIQQGISMAAYIGGMAAITTLFILVMIYASFVYWADKLVVTNFRVIFVDWKLLNVTEESEAELNAIQDIRIMEKGILTFIPFLDYGTLVVATAASEATIEFGYCPDPDEVKHFIFSLK